MRMRLQILRIILIIRIYKVNQLKELPKFAEGGIITDKDLIRKIMIGNGEMEKIIPLDDLYKNNKNYKKEVKRNGRNRKKKNV